MPSQKPVIPTFFSWLIPEYACRTSSELLTAWTVAVSFTLSVFQYVFFGLFILFLGDATSAKMLFAAAAPALLAVVILRYAKRAVIARECLLVVNYVLLMCLILRLGGNAAPTVMWLTVCPIIAVTSGSRVSGFVWLCVALVSMFGLYLYELEGAFLHPVVSDMPLLTFVSNAMLVVTVALYLYILDFNARTLSKRLRHADQRIHDLTVYDDATGVFTEREIVRLAEETQEEASRLNQPVCYCLFRIHIMNEVTRIWGVETTKTILHAISTRMEGVLRKNDLVGRLGNDALLVIMPGISHGAGNALARQLHESTNSLAFPEIGMDRIFIAYEVVQCAPGESSNAAIDRTFRQLFSMRDERAAQTPESPVF